MKISIIIFSVFKTFKISILAKRHWSTEVHSILRFLAITEIPKQGNQIMDVFAIYILCQKEQHFKNWTIFKMYKCLVILTFSHLVGSSKIKMYTINKYDSTAFAISTTAAIIVSHIIHTSSIYNSQAGSDRVFQTMF